MYAVSEIKWKRVVPVNHHQFSLVHDRLCRQHTSRPTAAFLLQLQCRNQEHTTVKINREVICRPPCSKSVQQSNSMHQGALPVLYAPTFSRKQKTIKHLCSELQCQWRRALSSQTEKYFSGRRACHCLTCPNHHTPLELSIYERGPSSMIGIFREWCTGFSPLQFSLQSM